MSRIVTPSSLKWLIDKRARISGQIGSLEKISPKFIEKLRRRLEEAKYRLSLLQKNFDDTEEALTVRLPELRIQLRAIDVALKLHDIQIDTGLIKPISPRAAKYLPHGTITRDIYEYLKFTGHPTPTKEIARYIAAKHHIEEDGLKFVTLTRIVRKRLKDLAAAGKIQRLHQRVTGKEGSWRLPIRPL